MNIKNIICPLIALLILSCSKDDESDILSGHFEIDQNAIDFGSVLKGGSKSIKATVTNGGEGDLLLKELQLSGTNASDFVLGSNVDDQTVQIGDSLELEVIFKPKQVGTKEAVLTVNSSAGVHTLKLSGESLNPDGLVQIPDAKFKAYLLGHGKTSNGTHEGYETSVIDTNEDGEIQLSEAWAQEDLIMCLDSEVTDMTGLEAFVNIRALLISGTQVSTLDLSKNAALEFVSVPVNQLTKLDVTELSNLQGLHCSDNQLTQLDISNNTALKNLFVYKNHLTSLDVSKNTDLERFSVSDNQLTSLDVTNNVNLIQLRAHNNQLSQLNVDQNAFLTELRLTNNQLNSLDVSKLTLLEELSCGNNQITNLDLSNNVELKNLSCIYNALTDLDVTQNTKLISLSCFNNALTGLDVSQNTAMQALYCGVNQLTALDVSSNVSLKYLTCEKNQLTSLNLSNGFNEKLHMIKAQENDLACIQIDEGFTPPASDWLKDDTASYSTNCL